MEYRKEFMSLVKRQITEKINEGSQTPVTDVANLYDAATAYKIFLSARNLRFKVFFRKGKWYEENYSN